MVRRRRAPRSLRAGLLALAVVLPMLVTLTPGRWGDAAATGGGAVGWSVRLGSPRSSAWNPFKRVKSLAERVAERIRRAAEAAKRQFQAARQRTQHAMEGVRSAARGMVGTARGLAAQARDAANQAKKAAQDAAASMRRSMQAAIDKAKQAANEIRRRAQDAVAAAKQAAEAAMRAAREALSHLPSLPIPLPLPTGGGIPVVVWPKPKVTCKINPARLGDSVEACDKRLTAALVAVSRQWSRTVREKADAAFEGVLEKVGEALLAGTGTTRDLGKRLIRAATTLAVATINNIVGLHVLAVNGDANIEPSFMAPIRSALKSLPLVGQAVGKLTGVVKKAALALKTLVVGHLLGSAGKLLDGLGVFVARAGTKVLRTLGHTRAAVREIEKRVEPLLKCWQKSGLNLKQTGVSLFADVVRNPKAALLSWTKKAFAFAKEKGLAFARAFQGLGKAARIAFSPAQLPKSDDGVDQSVWDRTIEKTIPREIKRRVKALGELALGKFLKTAEAVTRGTPYGCVIKYIGAAASQGPIKRLIRTVLGKVADGLGTVFAGMAKYLPTIANKVLYLVNEIVMMDSTASKIQDTVSSTFMSKMGRINQMVRQARQAIARGDRSSLARARTLADQLRNEIPFANFTFWVHYLKDPITDAFRKVSNDLIGFGIDFPVVLTTALYDTFDTVWKWVGELIPDLSDDVPWWLDAIIWVVKVTVKYVLPALQKVTTMLARWINNETITLASKLAFAALEKGTGAADDALAPVRTQLARKLPPNTPIALVASAMQSLYNKFVRPYLGAMQNHVAYLSSFIYGLTGQKQCFQKGGAR